MTGLVSVCAPQKLYDVPVARALVSSQFLEVTIGDVIATPVRNRVELNAVRELHLFLFGKPLELVKPLVTSPGRRAQGTFVGRRILKSIRKVFKLERRLGIV